MFFALPLLHLASGDGQVVTNHVGNKLWIEDYADYDVRNRLVVSLKDDDQHNETKTKRATIQHHLQTDDNDDRGNCEKERPLFKKLRGEIKKRKEETRQKYPKLFGTLVQDGPWWLSHKRYIVEAQTDGVFRPAPIDLRWNSLDICVPQEPEESGDFFKIPDAGALCESDYDTVQVFITLKSDEKNPNEVSLVAKQKPESGSDKLPLLGELTLLGDGKYKREATSTSTKIRRVKYEYEYKKVETIMGRSEMWIERRTPARKDVLKSLTVISIVLLQELFGLTTLAVNVAEPSLISEALKSAALVGLTGYEGPDENELLISQALKLTGYEGQKDGNGVLEAHIVNCKISPKKKSPVIETPVIEK